MGSDRLRIGFRVALLVMAVATAVAPEAQAAEPYRQAVPEASVGVETSPRQSDTGSAAVTASSPSVVVSAVGLDETRLRVQESSAVLDLLASRKRSDDAQVRRADGDISEMEGEAGEIAERTVKGAIRNFQSSRIESNLLEAVDLNTAVRAEAMGNAALVADTDTFAVYREKLKDIEIAEAIQELRLERNQSLGAEVERVEAELDLDLARLAELEERRIQRGAAEASIERSSWSQSVGRKQGFYLLVCPVDGPHSFIDSWGFARSGGRRHKGVDIMADIGVPVVAPVNGRVEHSSNRVGGRSFKMWDEFGNFYYGTHLSGFGKQGEVVAGEVIGYVGDDGNAAGIPHLHFEIHPGGRGGAINPYIDSASVCSGARS